MVRFRHYLLVSAVVTAAAVANAVHTRKNFYSVAIYLTTHKLNIVVGVNLCFLLLCLLGLCLKRVFLGTLARDELEELVQQSKYAITETMLALTIFREELNLRMLLLFTALLFIKIFHWLAAMRVEALARSEHLTRWQHLRLLALFTLMAVVDWAFVLLIGLSLIKSKTASVLLLFGFEYLILSVGLASSFCKYMLLVLDSRWEARGQHWNNKNTWMFYMELCADLVRLCLYLLFFLIICNFYGLPLHLIRELGLTFYTLRERVLKFVTYRRLTRNMQERFPDATQEELDAADRTCIVCREDMHVGSTKKLPCGHMFHFACLRTWLERSQSCPTCRHEIPVNAPPPAPAAAAPAAGGAAAAVAPAPGAAAAPAANAAAAPGGTGAAVAPLPPGLAALPADVQAHLEALGIRLPPVDPSAGQVPQRSASPLHPLFGTTPVAAQAQASPLHPLFGSTPVAPHNSPAHPLQYPSPHSAFPFGTLPLPAGAPFARGGSGQPTLAPIPPLVFPPPPVPPPPAHMFPLAGAPSPAGGFGAPMAGAPFPFAVGALSLPPSPALQAAYARHHAMLLQHHADFLRSSLAQVQLLIEQHIDAEKTFRDQEAAAAAEGPALGTTAATGQSDDSKDNAPAEAAATLTKRRPFQTA